MTRRVLLITLGASPQIVTETVYALVHGENWTPTDLVLTTTSSGEALFRNGDDGRGMPALLGHGGKWEGLLEALELDCDAVTIEIVVPLDQTGSPIADIRSPEEVNAFADAFLATLRRYAALPDSELHVSLAGGRKTMSYVAGMALSLVARSGDRLTHVLVHPESLERAPEFWWPGQTDPAEGANHMGETWRAIDARIDLHDVPFVRLSALTDDLKSDGFSKSVSQTSAAFDPDARLVVDVARGEIRVAGIVCAPKTPMQFAIYHLAAAARAEQWDDTAENGLTWSVLDEGNDNAGAGIFEDRFFDCLWKRESDARDDRTSNAAMDRLRDAIAERSGDTHRIRSWLESELSRLRSEIRDTFPRALAQRLTPVSPLNIAWAPDRIDIID